MIFGGDSQELSNRKLKPEEISIASEYSEPPSNTHFYQKNLIGKQMSMFLKIEKSRNSNFHLQKSLKNESF